MTEINSLRRKSTWRLFQFYCEFDIPSWTYFACRAFPMRILNEPNTRFLLSTHYTHYDFPTFMINLTSLIIVLIAKLPAMHKVRIFGINKVDTDWVEYEGKRAVGVCVDSYGSPGVGSCILRVRAAVNEGVSRPGAPYMLIICRRRPDYYCTIIFFNFVSGHFVWYQTNGTM